MYDSNFVVYSSSFIRCNLRNDSNRIFSGTSIADDVGDEREVNERNRSHSANVMTLVDAYSNRMERRIWLKDEIYAEYKEQLLSLSLHTFARMFRVCLYGDSRNKVSVYDYPTVVCFYPRFSSTSTGSDYLSYCRTSLIKYKPWIGSDDYVWRTELSKDASEEERDVYRSLIVNEWKDWLIYMEQNNIPFPEELRCRMDEHLNSNDHNDNDEGGIGVPSVHHVNEGNGLTNENPVLGQDSLNTGIALMQRFCSGDDDDFMRWDRDHNWDILVNDYPSYHTLDKVKEFYDKVVKDGTSESCRRYVDRSTLANEEQLRAHDVCIRACLLKEFDCVSSTDGGSDISRLQTVTGVGGTGKSYVIDAIVTTLVESHEFELDHIALFAPTGK